MLGHRCGAATNVSSTCNKASTGYSSIVSPTTELPDQDTAALTQVTAETCPYYHCTIACCVYARNDNAYIVENASIPCPTEVTPYCGSPTGDGATPLYYCMAACCATSGGSNACSTDTRARRVRRHRSPNSSRAASKLRLSLPIALPLTTTAAEPAEAHMRHMMSNGR